MRRWATAIAAVAAVAAGGGTARADEAADADRLRRLEDSFRRQGEEMERLRRDFEAYRRDHPASAVPTAGEIESAAAAYLAASGPVVAVAPVAASSRGVRWGGYFHWRYSDQTQSDSFFDMHRVILAAQADVTECIDFDFEIEVEHGGISGEIDGDVVLEKAEVRFHLSDAFTPKVGWLLIPFGRYNLYHDDPLNDLTERPFTARYLVPTGFGQPGIGAEGFAPFGCGHVFSYDVALTNGFEDAFSPSEGVRPARQAEDENDGKQVWARLAVRWETGRVLDALETGVSGTYGLYDEREENAVTGYALDFLARKGPFEVKGEWIEYDYERGPFDPPDAVEGQSGLWLEAAWHFFPCAWRSCESCLVRDTSHFTLVARWQTMDLDDDETGATFRDDLDAFTAGLNYRVTERTVIRVDHTWFDAEDDDDRRLWSVSVSTYF